jgi:hypothetical protein
MKVTRVQYTVQPSFTEQNKQNIEAVMSELRALNLADFKYASYVLEDGKTFMHLVHDNANDGSPLGNLESFKQFQSQLKDHFEISPKAESFACFLQSVLAEVAHVSIRSVETYLTAVLNATQVRGPLPAHTNAVYGWRFLLDKPLQLGIDDRAARR